MNRKNLLLSVAIGAAALVAVSCSLLNSDKQQTVTGPDTGQSGSADSSKQFAALEAQAKRYEQWIQKMDPYVTTNADGTYSFDRTKFLASLSWSDIRLQRALERGDTTSPDAKTILALKDGIAVRNAQVAQERKEPGSTALGVACWNYWWGRKCCYWGWNAYAVIGAFNLGAAVPGFNIILFGFGVWAGYLLDTYGGFCLNVSWAGGAWLTKP